TDGHTTANSAGEYAETSATAIETRCPFAESRAMFTTRRSSAARQRAALRDTTRKSASSDGDTWPSAGRRSRRTRFLRKRIESFVGSSIHVAPTALAYAATSAREQSSSGRT